MVKPSSSKNGGVYHLDPIGHRDDEHPMLDRFRNPTEKLGDFFHPMVPEPRVLYRPRTLPFRQ
jgi:hypothetical protein